MPGANPLKTPPVEATDSAAALASFLAAPQAAAYDPVTRQYLVFAWALERAARDGAVDPEHLIALCEQTSTIYQPELISILPLQAGQVPQLLNLLAQACAELVPARDFTKQALLISLEGGDGSGKSTQTQLLAEALTALGHPVVATRALGGAGGSALALRELILNAELQWDAVAEVLLTASIYRETFTGVIFPALAAGRHVVSDRLLDTLLVYFVNEAAGLDASALRQLYDILISDQAPGLEPDVTFILDLPYGTALGRRSQRSAGKLDRNEAKGEAFHRGVFERYRQLADGEARCVLIDALQLPATLTARMGEVVQVRLPLVSA